jgi:hypothetical protein
MVKINPSPFSLFLCGDSLGLTRVGMRSIILAVRMKSRFYRYFAGGAAFCFSVQLGILEA